MAKSKCISGARQTPLNHGRHGKSTHFNMGLCCGSCLFHCNSGFFGLVSWVEGFGKPRNQPTCRCLLRVQPTNSPLNLVTTRSFLLFDVSWKKDLKGWIIHVYVYSYPYVIVFFQDVVDILWWCIMFSFENEMIYHSIFLKRDFCESMVFAVCSPSLQVIVCWVGVSYGDVQKAKVNL